MYPFFFRGASTSFFITALAMYGCSTGPSNPPVTVPIVAPDVQEAAKCAKKRGDSITYQCESEIGPVFVTTVKDCSIPEKFTFQATTRQLLVGVVDLKVIRQEPIFFESLKSLHSLIHGTMDVDPFLMSIYTFHRNKCVTDLVVWKGSSREVPPEQESARFSAVSAKIAGQLVATLLPNKDLPNKELARAGN